MQPQALVLPFAALALGATAALTARDDYENVPPPPAEVLARVEGAATTLAQAASKAEEVSGGRVIRIGLEPDANAWAAEAVTEGNFHTVRVDATTGEVLEHEQHPPFEFPGRPLTGELTETESGLQYFDVVEGTGESPPGPRAQVKVHYSGWLLDGTQFDSSRERGEPAVFPLNQVIRGWTEGVQGMKEGGVRKLVVPYDLAYGEHGRPPIPPRATLVFDIELLEVL